MNRTTLLPAARLQAIVEAATAAPAEPVLEFCGSAADLAKLVGAELDPETVAMLDKRANRIGTKGVFRCAYAHAENPDVVIKVSAEAEANRREAEAWAAVKDTALAKWFAPVRWVSPDYYVLVQDRAVVGRDFFDVPRKKWPDEMPAIFGMINDMHAANFGFIGRQIVAIDYPDPNIAKYAQQLSACEMVPVSWHPKPKWTYYPLFGGKCGTAEIAADM